MTYCSVSKVDWTERSVYPWFLPVQTRWLDNDQYGHINNAVYHAMFDSVINIYLIRNLGLDISSTAISPRGYMARFRYELSNQTGEKYLI